jgi:hypothetical protein
VNNTHLFIALDSPLKESHYDGHKKIEKYLTSISGFKELTVFKREYNFGAVANFIAAQEEVFKVYDRLIVSEDDNFFSKNFLEYMNSGLDKYKNTENVLSVCGYNYPVQMPMSYGSDIYMWKGISGWGHGVWREKFKEVIFSLEEIEGFLRHPRNVLNLEKYAGNYLPALLHIIKTKQITGDTAICMHLVKNDMYCIFPVVSKVRNYGHDGSGVHCGISDIYSNQIIDENIGFEFVNGPIESENKEIYKILKNHFDTGYKAKIKVFIKYLLFLSKVNK